MNANQQAILEFIRACADEGEPPPTIREIMDVTGISSTSVVNYNLDALERDGHITRSRMSSRGIRLNTRELPGAGGETTKSEKLADTLRVMQVQIEDLQAEMERLRQVVKPAPIDEGEWQALNRAAR